MTVRVTQQIIVVGYKTDPPARVTSVALEVIRSTAVVTPTGTKAQTVIVAS